MLFDLAGLEEGKRKMNFSFRDDDNSGDDGIVNDPFRDESNGEDTDGEGNNNGAAMMMNEPFSLSGSLGLGDNSSGFLGSDGEDISQGYFAALSQTGFDGIMSDEEEDNNNSNNGVVEDGISGGVGSAIALGMGMDDWHRTAEYKKTIRFADDVAFGPSGFKPTSALNLEDDSTGQSESSFDLFGSDADEGSISDLDGSASVISEDTHNDEDEIDKEKEEEKKIIRSMLFAGFGVGIISFLGWAGQKMMNRVNSSKDADGAGTAVDQAGNAAQETAVELAKEGGIQAAEQAAMDTAFNASMNASMTQSSSNSMAVLPIGPNPGMSGAQ